MAKKILVVDDEPDAMEVATSRLRRLGYAVISAVTADEALAFLENNTPNLILLDLLLPNMQGDELCRRLKTNIRFKKVPIILFADKAAQPSLPLKMKEMGADDYVFKPFMPQDVLAKVRKLLG